MNNQYFRDFIGWTIKIDHNSYYPGFWLMSYFAWMSFPHLYYDQWTHVILTSFIYSMFRFSTFQCLYSFFIMPFDLLLKYCSSFCFLYVSAIFVLLSFDPGSHLSWHPPLSFVSPSYLYDWIWLAFELDSLQHLVFLMKVIECMPEFSAFLILRRQLFKIISFDLL